MPIFFWVTSARTMNDRDMTLPPYWRVNHYVCMLSKDFEIDVSDINFFEEEIKSVESEGQLLQMNVNDQWVPHLINLSWKQFRFFLELLSITFKFIKAKLCYHAGIMTIWSCMVSLNLKGSNAWHPIKHYRLGIVDHDKSHRWSLEHGQVPTRYLSSWEG